MPRHERTCPCCRDADGVDDELHVFACSAAPIRRLCRKFQDILKVDEERTDTWMRNVMNPASAGQWRRLAQFLMEFDYERERFLRDGDDAEEQQRSDDEGLPDLPDEL